MITFDFSGQVALVTGASRGIGREIAQMLAQAGAHVIVHYHSNIDAAKQTLQSLAGDVHMVAQADMANPHDLEKLVEVVMDNFGRIDILINNAGIFTEHPIATTDFDAWKQAWDSVINTNLIGSAHLIYLAAQHMMAAGGGRIVNISSRGAFRGEPDAPAYGASKAGMNAMGQSLAKALAPHNIFVGTVAPGFVETDMAAKTLNGSAGDGIRNQSPLKRVALPHEVARTALFLAAEGTEFLTGCIIDVNGASYLRT